MTGGVQGRRRRVARAGVALLAVGAVVAAGCASGGGGGDGAPADDAVATTTTVVPPVFTATTTGEEAVNPGYRQGVARLDDGGWIFSGTTVLARVDADLNQEQADTTAVPDRFVPDGYNHVGDVDVEDGILYVPLEQPEYQRDEQIMACFDPQTLTMTGSQEVAQRHNSFIAVDGDRAYSMKGFSGDQILVYEVGAGCTFEPLEPIALSVRLNRVQGADVAAGALWLATDDAVRGLYRADLATGAVSTIGAMAHVAEEGEGEGIDATTTDQGLLHVVNIVDTLDVRFEHFDVADEAGEPVTSTGD